jgi:hypothetical protein
MKFHPPVQRNLDDYFHDPTFQLDGNIFKYAPPRVGDILRPTVNLIDRGIAKRNPAIFLDVQDALVQMSVRRHNNANSDVDF